MTHFRALQLAFLALLQVACLAKQNVNLVAFYEWRLFGEELTRMKDSPKTKEVVRVQRMRLIQTVA